MEHELKKTGAGREEYIGRDRKLVGSFDHRRVEHVNNEGSDWAGVTGVQAVGNMAEGMLDMGFVAVDDDVEHGSGGSEGGGGGGEEGMESDVGGIMGGR